MSEEALDLSMKSRDRRSSTTSGLQNYERNEPCPDSLETMEYNNGSRVNEERHVNGDVRGSVPVSPHAPVARYPIERTMTNLYRVNHIFQRPFLSPSNTEVNVKPDPSLQAHSLHPSLQHPSLQHPSLQHPSLQHPSLQHPSLQHPLLQARSPQAPSPQAPALRAALLQAPSPQAPPPQAPPPQSPSVPALTLQNTDGFISTLLRTLYRPFFPKPHQVDTAFKRPLDVSSLRVPPHPNPSLQTLSKDLDKVHAPTGEKASNELIIPKPITACPVGSLSFNGNSMMVGPSGIAPPTAASLHLSYDKVSPTKPPNLALTPRVVPRKRRAEPSSRSSSGSISSASNTRVGNSREGDSDNADSDNNAGVPKQSSASQDDSASSFDDRDGATSSGVIKDAKYFERRKKNNKSAKKSRDARRGKIDDVERRVKELEFENLALKTEIGIRSTQVAGLRERLINGPSRLDLNVYTSDPTHN